MNADKIIELANQLKELEKVRDEVHREHGHVDERDRDEFSNYAGAMSGISCSIHGVETELKMHILGIR